MSKKEIEMKIKYDVEYQEKNKEIQRLYIALRNREQEIERLNNIINELEKLELYEYTPDYDYDENLVDDYTPFNIENYIEELIGSEKE